MKLKAVKATYTLLLFQPLCLFLSENNKQQHSFVGELQAPEFPQRHHPIHRPSPGRSLVLCTHQVHYQFYVYTHIMFVTFLLPTHTHRTMWWPTSTHCRPWSSCIMSVASSTSTSQTPPELTTLSHCGTLSSISATSISILSWWVGCRCR